MESEIGSLLNIDNKNATSAINLFVEKNDTPRFSDQEILDIKIKEGARELALIEKSRYNNRWNKNKSLFSSNPIIQQKKVGFIDKANKFIKNNTKQNDTLEKKEKCLNNYLVRTKASIHTINLCPTSKKNKKKESDGYHTNKVKDAKTANSGLKQRVKV